MIVINDDDGWRLSDTFICDGIGYDIYCTTWQQLEEMSEYNDVNIGKLMQSDIVYSADKASFERLELIRAKATENYKHKLDETIIGKVKKAFETASSAYGKLMYSESLSQCRKYSAGMLYLLENMICMLNRKYYKLGTKRVLEELSQMKRKPKNFIMMINAVVMSSDIDELRKTATVLIRSISDFIDGQITKVREKQAPAAESLCGTYEEFFSNWRNKMYYAAEIDNAHFSLLSAFAAQYELDDMAEWENIEKFNLFESFNPSNLLHNAEEYDKMLCGLEKEYVRTGISVEKYENINEFVKAYNG